VPEYREYERMSTTAVNAYVSPVLDRYLGDLSMAFSTDVEKSDRNGTGKARLRVMQSNGGLISLDEARRSGVRCILSGPAGGVIGAQTIAQMGQFASFAPSHFEDSPPDLKLITFDMGGTSTDVSLIDGVLW
jgi:N-methylhydantoinase A